jgi:hypothetical protein
MIIKLKYKPKKDLTIPQKWFAWYQVIIDKHFVWFSTVYRRRQYHIWDGLDWWERKLTNDF